MSPRALSVVLFDGFELLDVVGPVSLFSAVPDLAITYLGPEAGCAVASSQGARLVADAAYADAAAGADILLVPGGIGTRALVQDAEFVRWLADCGGTAALVTSVCTGSGLLAAAGLLDGYRATSNKRAFGWATGNGRSVEWVPKARWVQDRDRWTSSGVAAGMDMAAALLRAIWGEDVATEAAARIELEVHGDPEWDPFAALYGLG